MATIEELLQLQKELQGNDVSNSPETPAPTESGGDTPSASGAGNDRPDVYIQNGRLQVVIRPRRDGEAPPGEGGYGGSSQGQDQPSEQIPTYNAPQEPSQQSPAVAPLTPDNGGIQPAPSVTAQPQAQTQPAEQPAKGEEYDPLASLKALRDSIPVDTAKYPQTATEGHLTAPENDIASNFAARANDVIAHTLALPKEAIDYVASASGATKMAPWFFNQEPGAAIEAMKSRFDALGIYNTPAAQGLAASIGKNAADGVITTAMMLAVAPTVVSTTGATIARGTAGTTTNVVNWMAKAIKDMPYLSLFQGASSGAGSGAATEVTGSPYAAFPGALAGGMVGTVAGKAVQAPLKAASSLIERLAAKFAPSDLPVRGNTDIQDDLLNAIRPKATTLTSKSPALREAMAQPEAASSFAQQQVEGARMHMETAVRDAIEHISSSQGAGPASASVRAGLDKAERIGNRIVGDYWEKTPLKAPIPMNGIKNDVIAMRDELLNPLTGKPSTAPVKEIKDVLEISLPKRGADGRMVSSLPSLQRVRDEIAKIRIARLNEEGKAYSGLPVNDGLVRNYNRLTSILENGIMEALPNDTSVAQARQTSIMYHDLFSRGNIADVLARRARGDYRYRPDQTVEELMKRHQGLADLMNVSENLPGAKGPFSTAAEPGITAKTMTQAERASLDKLQTDAEDAIKGMFREATQDLDPQAAQRWIARHEGEIKPMARLSASFDWVSQKLSTLVENRKTLEKSALARYSQMDPQKAIDRVWNDKNPSGTARELMKTFEKDTEALDGFRAGVLDKVFNQSRLEPAMLKDLLSQPKVQRLLEASLSEEQYARLYKMSDVAYRIAHGDIMSLKQHYLPSVSIIARIFGAHLGGGISRLFGGGGGLQPQAIMSQYMKGSVLKAFKGYDANYMLQRAVRDPEWERLLYSREPNTKKEFQDTANLVRNVVRSEEGWRNGVKRDIERKGSGDGPISPANAGEVIEGPFKGSPNPGWHGNAAPNPFEMANAIRQAPPGGAKIMAHPMLEKGLRNGFKLGGL